ncbi:hypothetical protein HPP92_008393 [Vanilla planifolia]|uniref:Uncharacterized protein n=1 Tax=Vanilla planifolia TaxID=51239 RepID=A0A835V1X8_VANPL|nr:hypothetical protein HPP92_008393 [Vanilla planifolia]
MAVPARDNDLDDHQEGEEGLFEEEAEAWEDIENDVLPHLRPIADAAKRGDVDALRLALDNHNGSIDDPIEDGDTVLHLCCLYGSLSCVQLLVDRGANFEAKDEEGAIPLHDACAGGYAEIVQLILNCAGNSTLVKQMLDTTDAEGDTPLHHAARGEHMNVVQLLLTMGASPAKANAYGKVPAELADHGTELRRILEEATTQFVARAYNMASSTKRWEIRGLKVLLLIRRITAQCRDEDVVGEPLELENVWLAFEEANTIVAQD